MYFIIFRLAFQALSARDIEDGQRRGFEPTDFVFVSPPWSHLLVVGKFSRVDEHGHSGHATRIQNPRRSCPAVGVINTQR